MITAVDTNVLLDLLIPRIFRNESAADQLERAGGEGKLIVSEVVYAELAAYFSTGGELENLWPILVWKLSHRCPRRWFEPANRGASMPSAEKKAWNVANVAKSNTSSVKNVKLH